MSAPSGSLFSLHCMMTLFSEMLALTADTFVDLIKKSIASDRTVQR